MHFQRKNPFFLSLCRLSLAQSQLQLYWLYLKSCFKAFISTSFCWVIRRIETVWCPLIFEWVRLHCLPLIQTNETDIGGACSYWGHVRYLLNYLFNLCSNWNCLVHCFLVSRFHQWSTWTSNFGCFWMPAHQSRLLQPMHQSSSRIPRQNLFACLSAYSWLWHNLRSTFSAVPILRSWGCEVVHLQISILEAWEELLQALV